MFFIRPKNLSADSIILDVRSPEEHQTEELKLPHFKKELSELNPLEFMRENNLSSQQTIHIICASGARASQAAEKFEKAGFSNVAVIIGGIVEAEYEGLEIIRH
jgi:rhodanese-related sulfurtransferase